MQPGTVFTPKGDDSNDQSDPLANMTNNQSNQGMPSSDSGSGIPVTPMPASDDSGMSTSDPMPTGDPTNGMSHDDVHEPITNPPEPAGDGTMSGSMADSGSSDSPPTDSGQPPMPVSDTPSEPTTPVDEPSEPTDTPADPPMPTEPPAADPPPADPSDSTPPAAPDTGQFSWRAHEFAQHERPFFWYLGFIVLAIGLLALSILVLKSWLGAVVIGLMLVALVTYAHRSPRELQYSISQTGLSIGGKFFPYSSFRSFAIVSMRSFLTLELDPLKRFMPRLSIFLDQPTADQVGAILAKHLPQEDRRSDLIDQLSHALKF